MQRVSAWVGGHHPVANVRLDNLGKCRIKGKHWQIRDQCEPLCDACRVAATQLVQHGRAALEGTGDRG